MHVSKKWIRLCVMYNLIFFSLLLLFYCERKKPDEIKLIWNNQRATGISVSKKILIGGDNSPEKRITVRLAKEGSTSAMLGNYKAGGNEIIFEPLIPFTPGLHYQVLVDNQIVEEIQIPMMGQIEAPILLAIYPTNDTLPENLLKIYLQFSKPMREGESVNYVKLIRNDRDTLLDVFLHLQPELWNEDRTMLTVWLDPGRIKRGLQPNLKLGAPLVKGEHYTLLISDRWKDIQGVALIKSFTKKFITTKRDSLSPDPRTWTIRAPMSKTEDVLSIDLKSSLDYSLLNSTLHIVDEKGKTVLGKWQVENEEKNVRFTPNEQWENGSYELQIETRLEDLAGNNISRPFDVDMKANKKQLSQEKVISLPFKVSNDLNN